MTMTRLPDRVDRGHANLSVATHQRELQRNSGCGDDPIRQISYLTSRNKFQSVGDTAVHCRQRVRPARITKRPNQNLACNRRESSLLAKLRHFHEANRGGHRWDALPRKLDREPLQ
jgi:hypothetical protein